MPKYIFLDTWLLNDYTKPDRVDALARFITRNGYTIVLTSSLLVELYNAQWQGQDERERGHRVTQFLGSQHCVIADPLRIWHREFQSYPKPIKQMPVELDLDKIPHTPRTRALLMFLRRDQIFLDMGKDIEDWVRGYEQAKKEWLTDKDNIIEDAIRKGELIRDTQGHVTAIDDAAKQQFLFRLDMRPVEDMPDEELPPSGKNYDPYIEGIFRYRIFLRGIRLTSLGFWYKYIDFDPRTRLKEAGSDLFDIYHMSFIPWCVAYTADKNMLLVVKRAAVEAKCTSCKIIGKQDLDKELSIRQRG